ncbi:hypothetical protein WJX72_008680 [[Myrmecia] bisecta]|uniref:Uncharacterized protein n=1 Tax=[Myrmecia] bisecta TaxID=41462 RepID=A0AAW1P4S8_9CHLO
MGGKSQSKKPTSFRRGGNEYRVGDCVLVKLPKGKPGVAKIRGLAPAAGGNTLPTVEVCWFYRPEETSAGRKSFHAVQEVFRSDHIDTIEADTVAEPCEVHTWEAYMELEEISETDFFSRFTYKAATEEYLPKKIAVHCQCNLPYTPDEFMVQCNECAEWFHPACIGLGDIAEEELQKQTSFSCPNCTAVPTSKKQRCS